ncbi:MAG: starvation-sensing protein RspA [Acidimicrobiia bacterium]|nr:starvation-sensing protein RspA [Acidimicrobiia bacterium]
MNRRELFESATLTAAALGLKSLWPAAVEASQAVSGARQRGLPPVTITEVKSVLTAPAGRRLAVVKVLTSEPGLYGLGCATFTQRIRAVQTAIDVYLRPFLIGKSPWNIEDVWHSSFFSSYWRNGPVLNNALSAVDMALWDILGKWSGLPVYQLLGGKCREAVDTYTSASGKSFDETAESVQRLMDAGYRHVRCEPHVPETPTDSVLPSSSPLPGNQQRRTWEAGPYARNLPRFFEHLRKKVGFNVELVTDVHELLPPILAIQLAKDLEPYRLFFLEDPLSPEDVGYFTHLRQQSSTPIAMGELFNNPNEWLNLVSGRLIDFIRVHISQVGGISMARKLATLCEFFRVRTAWHGPGDCSPVGHAANLHLDFACHNFGIQEFHGLTQAEQDVFPGSPQQKRGYLYVSDKPGLGVDLDEKLAARFPIKDDPSFDMHWGNLRQLDGTIVKP